MTRSMHLIDNMCLITRVYGRLFSSGSCTHSAPGQCNTYLYHQPLLAGHKRFISTSGFHTLLHLWSVRYDTCGGRHTEGTVGAVQGPPWKTIQGTTVFPWNLAAARFNFETLFHAATIRGWLDFEGSIYTLDLTRGYHPSMCRQQRSTNIG